MYWSIILYVIKFSIRTYILRFFIIKDTKINVIFPHLSLQYIGYLSKKKFNKVGILQSQQKNFKTNFKKYSQNV